MTKKKADPQKGSTDPKSSRATIRGMSQKDKRRMEKVTCPTCKGSGKYGDHTCGLCNGAGTIWATP